MNGIKMSDCKFYVDEEARTVVCVIPEILKKNDVNVRIENMVTDFLEENCDFSDIRMYDAIDYWSRFSKELKMPRSFIGKAVCSTEDEWDVEKGKKIAFIRAKDKCYRSFFKRARLFVNTLNKRLEDTMEKFNDFGIVLTAKQQNMNENFKEKYGFNLLDEDGEVIY